MMKNRSHYNKRIFSVTSIIICAAFLFLVNAILYLLAQNYTFLNIDLTRDKLFVLSPTTVDFIKSLDKDVTIYILATEDNFADTSAYNAQANQVFRQFQKNGPKISLVYVDYVKNPSFAAAYPDLMMKQGDILVTCNKTNAAAGTARRVLVKTEELFNYSGTQRQNMTIVSSRAEEAIYTAILSVTSDRPLKAAIISGHGEYAIDAFIKVLEKNNYEMSAINLVSGTIDPSFDMAFIIAPRQDFGETELNTLDNFLYNSGNYGKTIFYCASADQPELPNIATFLREWGATIGDGVVFETNEQRVYNYQPFYAVADYAEDEFSSLLQINTKPVLVPVCRPLVKNFDYRNNYSTKVLLEFSASTGVRPSNAPAGFKADDATIRGPLPALILCRYSLMDRSTGKPDKVSNILVSGSAVMLDSLAVDNPSFSNTEYLVNIFNRLSSRIDIIPLAPKSFTGSGLNLPRLTVNIIGLAFIVILPLLILATGITIWIKRKRS